MSFLKPTPASSSSSNVNNGLITSTYGGQMGAGVGATNFLAQLLGVGGGSGSSSGTSGYSGPSLAEIQAMKNDGIPGNYEAAMAAYNAGGGGTSSSGSSGASAGDATAGYNNYLQMAGYAPAMRQLSQNITGQGAAAGILQSGSTAKALQTRGTELNQSFFNNYLQQLAGLSGLGLQAGGLVANTGQQSKSTGGGPSTIGTLASIAGSVAPLFSDRRLKRDIELIGRAADGLGIYVFRYVMGAKRVLGVMADEVAKLRPWALGPARAGFATVNYGAL
jgi:hypothetical protein